jgi:aspartyl-tRNA(Asn)/glutamyl-tRNA(Gln) amidotransferase subunit A
MLDAEIAFLSVEQAGRLLRSKKISPVDLVEAALARIERLNPRLNAFLTVTAEAARQSARRAEREILKRRYRGPLHGIPLSLKDNIWTRGVRTTAGSKILADFVPEADATVARKLFRAGAILIGKTMLHEFAYGITSENPHYGPVRNPWALERVSGGSSGGSAAALASGIGFVSVGTDTGGSIRIPAALCGIVGLKPTFGRVSSYGVVPLARSLDHTGPLARTVADAAIMLRVIAGRDPLDPTAAAKPVPDYRGSLRGGLRSVRLGWPREYFFERVDAEVKKAIEAAANQFEKLGAAIEEISLPNVSASDEPSTQIALAEANSYHELAGFFPARAAEYGEDVRKRLEMGRSVRAVDYLAALEARKKVVADFEAAFVRVDAILAPTVPVPAPPLGEKIVKIGDEEESVRSALIRMNRPGNLAGLPAISIPCGFTRDGLPIGLQLMGRAWDEARLLRIACAYEQATEWHTRHPFDDSRTN